MLLARVFSDKSGEDPRAKEARAQFSLDDFGTGYSSLSYLKQTPVDTLKTDESFVRDVETEPENEGFIAAMLALANSSGLKVISERVERPKQLKVLRGLGPELAQGYYFAKPMPGAEVWDHLPRLRTRSE